ncbi:Nucleotidyl transferase AbiEii toxin, Type IV TA system [Variovorax sp. YR266]|uniref:nucleotidyl transferase AbiEii/AbiGii toxin family protein n=1 Tax=Variovorax sp. YR266 TaxID=1884386 RepID=UPI000897C2FC|nr:nucleotidyl transferase AbiEii/AbiGii toxin family protein [Variovorax sp. YR266]SDZ70541.1 Nucleotidyl transferase AbiEii toxin, Type IV TA system [Variovorax sp. YR266]
MLEEIDLPQWVSQAPADKRNFREAVHIILTAIGTSTALRSKMIMKGGLLMAIRYDSGRFTKDVDFSTREKYAAGMEQELIDELDQQLEVANDALSYDTMCRRQRAEIRPARPDAQFPTLALNIGYAPRSKRNELDRLLNRQAPTIVEIDYSYNEAVYDVEILELGDGDQLRVYSFLNLMAEKLRSLLQQPIRRRNRRQDVYDLHLLVTQSKPLSDQERASLLILLQASCRAREIEPGIDSLADPKVREMAKQGYEELSPEIEGALPPFDVAYATVQAFYAALPWNAMQESVPPSQAPR